MIQNIPAERVTPGVGHQVVNVHHPVTGEFVHSLRGHGTEVQIRARGELGFYHPVEDREHWIFLRAIITGEIPSTREDLLRHIDTHAPCQSDDDTLVLMRGLDMEVMTVLELAEYVWAAHLYEAHMGR